MFGWSRDEAARVTPLKAFECTRLAGEFAGKEFDRHAPAKFQVFGFKDQPNTPSAEKPEQPVMGNALAEQRMAIAARSRGFGGGDCPRFLNCRDEAVSTARQGLRKAGMCRVVVQDLSDLSDGGVDTVVAIEKDILPHTASTI